MEEKISEMRSNAGSREDSMSKRSDKTGRPKSKNQFLSVEYLKDPNMNSVSQYEIRGRKGYGDEKVKDSRSTGGR